METPVQGRTRRAYLALFTVTVIWGWTFAWMKSALDAASAALGPSGLPAAVGVFLLVRFGLAAAALPLFLPAARPARTAGPWRAGLILALLLIAGFLLQMSGLSEVTPAVSAFLTSLYVVFTALLSPWLTHHRHGATVWLGVTLATAGAAFISGPPQLHFDLPEWLTVACALVFAVHIHATDRFTRREPPLALSTTSFACSAALSLLVLAWGLTRDGGPSAGQLLELLRRRDFWLPLFFCASLGTFVALSLMNAFQKELPPVRAAILYALEPVWAALIATCSGLMSPDRWLYLGGAALLLGNLVAELRPRRRASPASLPQG